MAFPTVATTSSGSDTADALSRSATLPTGIAAGDLLLAFVGMDGSPATTITGWTQFFDPVNGGLPAGGIATAKMYGFYRIADGSEGASVTIATGASESGGWVFYRVTGWHGTTPPEVSAGARASSTNPDPDALTPSWGAADTLWIATAANDGNVAITAAPTNYNNNFINARRANTAGAGVAVGWRQLNAASDNPGVFTMTSEDWAAATVGVRPALATPSLAALPASRRRSHRMVR